MVLAMDCCSLIPCENLGSGGGDAGGQAPRQAQRNTDHAGAAAPQNANARVGRASARPHSKRQSPFFSVRTRGHFTNAKHRNPPHCQLAVLARSVAQSVG